LNLKQSLEYARNELRTNNISDASLEGEILLRHVLSIDRAQLFSQLDQKINPDKIESIKRALARRIDGEPAAYITGHKEFYGLDFIVNHSVLIPRPETELLVEKTIALTKRRKILTIADVGTGSGAIAVALAVNLPRVTLYATDISATALEVAVANAAMHGVTDRITFLQGNLLEPLPAEIDLVIANLPYVMTSGIKNDGALAFEPAGALDGGEDGLERFREFCRAARKKLVGEACILMEVGKGQASAVRVLLEKSLPGRIIGIERDLAGIERVIMFCLT
jgi:release factor glutamine methyltransferase